MHVHGAKAYYQYMLDYMYLRKQYNPIPIIQWYRIATYVYTTYQTHFSLAGSHKHSTCSGAVSAHKHRPACTVLPALHRERDWQQDRSQSVLFPRKWVPWVTLGYGLLEQWWSSPALCCNRGGRRDGRRRKKSNTSTMHWTHIIVYYLAWDTVHRVEEEEVAKGMEREWLDRMDTVPPFKHKRMKVS